VAAGLVLNTVRHHICAMRCMDVCMDRILKLVLTTGNIRLFTAAKGLPHRSISLAPLPLPSPLSALLKQPHAPSSLYLDEQMHATCPPPTYVELSPASCRLSPPESPTCRFCPSPHFTRIR
jgi:hypothetical protein